MTTSSQVMMERKIKRVTALRLDDPSMRSALDVVGEFYTENTAEARRQLKSNVERRQVEYAEKFLRQFAPVKEALLAVERRAVQLESHVSGVASSVRSADDSCRLVLAEYRALEERRDEAIRRRDAVDAFLSQYQLQPSELEALEEAEPLSRNFLAALKKVRMAREGCAADADRDVLEGGVSTLTLLETLASQHEAAISRLFEFVMSTMEETVSLDESSDRESPLALAVAELSLREAYDRDVREAVARCRGDGLRRRFEREFEEEDDDASVLRRSSDACAWIHQKVANETDLADALFPGNYELAAQIASNLVEPFTVVLDRAVSEARDDVVGLRKSEHVLRFYSGVFADKLREEGQGLSECVKECAEMAGEACSRQIEKVAASTRESRVAEFVVKTTANDDDDTLADDKFYSSSRKRQQKSEHFVSSDILRRHVDLATQLLGADAEKLGADAGDDDGRNLAKQILDPAIAKLKVCLALADQRTFASSDDLIGRENPPTRVNRRELGAAFDWSNSDACVFVANNAAAAKVQLSPNAEASLFDELIEDALIGLAAHETSNVLRRCKLAPALEYAHKAELLRGDLQALGGPASAFAPPADLADALRTFYSSLFSDATPELADLADPGHRSRTRKVIAKGLAKAHATLHALVTDPRIGNYDDSSFLVHTPRQVYVLLDCEDDDDDYGRQEP